MKIAFITTVLNEEENVILLLKSLLSQTRRPDEIIIVDGGSRDNTVGIIRNWIEGIRSDEFKKKIKLIKKTGNRSVGRNEAINKTSCEIIVSSDAGCILDKDWIRNITKPFRNKDVEVVAGFYKGFPRSIFEKSLLPYVLVMPDRVDPNNFAPSTRSMAFRKSIWDKVGGFPVRFSSNEDFVFANKLKKYGAKIVFRKNSVVHYIPRKNLSEAFAMFFRFALGDSESGIFRPKVALIIIRYIVFVWFLVYAYIFKLFFILEVIFYILILYVVWAILKNYKYVKDREAIIFLPLIQFTSDFAVITGTLFGFLRGLWDTRRKQ